MDKLELRHLAPYLPYGLKVRHYVNEHDNAIVEMDGCAIEDVIGYDSYKPILRPLSDFTKEIEHNGDKFEPYELAKQVVDPEQWLKICEMIDTDGGEYSKIADMPYWWVKLHLEWHFDVFGLIEAGLAIDINTIK